MKARKLAFAWIGPLEVISLHSKTRLDTRWLSTSKLVPNMHVISLQKKKYSI
jgi:hypothetical protein